MYLSILACNSISLALHENVASPNMDKFDSSILTNISYLTALWFWIRIRLNIQCVYVHVMICAYQALKKHKQNPL